jgi:hypothetical protein
VTGEREVKGDRIPLQTDEGVKRKGEGEGKTEWRRRRMEVAGGEEVPLIFLV